MDMTRLLLISGFTRKIHGFRLVTRRKAYELGSEEAGSRENWVTMMRTVIKAYGDFHQPDALLRYVQTVGRLKETERRTYLHRVKTQSYSVVTRNLQHTLTETELDIVSLTLENLVLKLELEENQRKSENLLGVIDDLTAKQPISPPSLSVYTVGIEGNRRFVEGWKVVVGWIPIGEVFAVSQVSRRLRKMCGVRLGSYSFWNRQVELGLAPRARLWPYYFLHFRPFLPSKPTSKPPLPLDIHSDIQRDLTRSSLTSPHLLHKLLVHLCERFPDVGYCQGMHFVVEFVFNTVKSEEITRSLMVRLMNPPYSLAEVWKTGLPRAKLVSFQLDQLVQLRLPRLSSHFQSLDLPFEVLVTPWILTLFTQLTHIPAETLEFIWDLFIVKGWVAVVTVALVVLQGCETEVVGKSLEDTMALFDKDFKTDFTRIKRLYDQFEPTSELLTDLERRFRYSF